MTALKEGNIHPYIPNNIINNMSSNPPTTQSSADKHLLLEMALKRSQEVKEKMEKCASELFAVNEQIKKEMIVGSTLQQMKKALAQSESIEDKVEKCARELHEVNEVLAREIEERNQLNRDLVETLQKLSTTGNVLCDTHDVLAVAHEVVDEATQRTLRDFVTGIPTRALFNDRLAQAIALAKRCDWVLAVMFIDLDRFKLINDTHGHAVGDKVLQIVAQRLQKQVRTEDIVCRYGGDEFLYLLVNPESKENIHRLVTNVRNRLSQLLIIDELALTIEPSIGIALYPNDGSTGQELVANADIAMYQAKQTKAGYLFFDNVKVI